MTTLRADRAEHDERADADKDIVRGFVDGLIYCIRAGTMIPGQHLVESELTRRFGVSRSSLREGLKQLASIGVVTLTRFRGAFISVLDRDNVRDLLQVLEPLCTLAARLAAERSQSEDDKVRLLAIAAELGPQTTTRGDAAYLENRRRFYDLLVAMGGNSELDRVIPLARTDLFRAQLDKVQTRKQHDRHAGGYTRIAEAVAANDPQGAERAVRRHFEGTRRTIDALPDHAFAVRSAPGS